MKSECVVEVREERNSSLIHTLRHERIYGFEEYSLNDASKYRFEFFSGVFGTIDCIPIGSLHKVVFQMINFRIECKKVFADIEFFGMQAGKILKLMMKFGETLFKVDRDIVLKDGIFCIKLIRGYTI